MLAGDERIEPEAVVAATGYRTGLEPVVGHLDAHGVPTALHGEAAFGPRLIGYDPRPAQLRYCGREAVRAARAVARASKRALIGGSLPSAQRAGAG